MSLYFTMTYAGTAWVDRAACRGIPGFTEADPDYYLPVCGRCPVRDECFEFGVSQVEGSDPRQLCAPYGGMAPALVVREALRRQGHEATSVRLRGRERTIARVARLLAAGMDPSTVRAECGYKKIYSLRASLVRWGRADLAERLRARRSS